DLRGGDGRRGHRRPPGRLLLRGGAHERDGGPDRRRDGPGRADGRHRRGCPVGRHSGGGGAAGLPVRADDALRRVPEGGRDRARRARRGPGVGRRDRALRVRSRSGQGADRAARAAAARAGAGDGRADPRTPPRRRPRARQSHAADPGGGAGLRHARRDGWRPARRVGRAQGTHRLLTHAVGTARPAWVGYKPRSFELLLLVGGDHVLDVGCGTGEDARAIASGTPDVSVTGVDASEDKIREARARTLGLPRPVDFRVADAYALPFDDGTFDACRADRVFHHLVDPEKALAEMVRVTRPGGRVVVSDTDYDTLVGEAADPGLTS